MRLWTNADSGGGGGTETDPVFSASPAAGITSSDISAWNGKSDFSGDYDDLTNKPAIPANVSDLANDSGFVNAQGAAAAAPVQSVNGQAGAVSVKEAASATVFQLGAGDSGVTSFGTGIYDPNTSTVRIYLAARSASNIGFTTILATVPEAYRPSAVATLFGFFGVNSAPIAYTGRLFTNGVILQDLSASAREVFLCGEYVI